MTDKSYKSIFSIFEDSLKLGNQLEATMKRMYEGDCDWQSVLRNIFKIIDKLPRSGCLTKHTAEKMKEFLYCTKKYKRITSVNSEKVLLWADDAQEIFELEELMKWFACELSNDNCFRYYLSDDRGYSGVKRLLNRCLFETDVFIPEDCIDFLVYEKICYYTIEEDEDCVLYYIENPSKNNKTKKMLLHNNLIDGRLFRNANGSCLMVNLNNNGVYLYNMAFGKRLSVVGKGLGVLDNDCILISDNDKLISIDFGKRETEYNYVEFSGVGFVEINGNSIAVRSYDCTCREMCQKVQIHGNQRYTTEYCEWFDKKVIWKKIVDDCFIFQLDCDTGLSEQLFICKAYMPPVCMSLENIADRICQVTRYIEDGKGKFGEKYPELVMLLDWLNDNYSMDEDVTEQLVKSELLYDRENKFETYRLWELPYW